MTEEMKKVMEEYDMLSTNVSPSIAAMLTIAASIRELNEKLEFIFVGQDEILKN